MENQLDDDIKNWRVCSPESVGIPSQSILDFIDELDSEELNMHGFIMIKGRKVIAEGYYSPFDHEFQHRMYSVGKSFTAVAVGLLKEEGKLSLEDKICDHFPDKLPIQGIHPYIRMTTIRDMLMMATPHSYTTYKQIECDDWVKTFFEVEPARYPGTCFVYDTSSTHVLSALVERLSGMPLLSYLRARLLDELGCSESMKFLTCPMGISQGGSGLICTLRDLAKFAYMCLHHGRFGGKQLIPEKFIREATSKQIDTCMQPVIEERQGYGYQFWRCRNNGFALYGIGGQLAICLPDHNFLLVTAADNMSDPNGVQAIYEALWHQILPSLKKNDSLAQEPGISAKLNERLSGLKVRTVAGALSTDILPMVSGKTYEFPNNSMGLVECRFELNPEEGRGIWFYRNSDGNHELAFGLGHIENQRFPGTDFNCITSAAWVEENKLHIKIYIIDECFDSLNMTITFVANMITISMKKGIEPFLKNYDGFVSGKYKEELEYER